MDEIRDEIVSWFKGNFAGFSPGQWVLLMRNSTLPRGIEIIAKNIAEKLGIKVVEVKEGPAIINYQNLNAEERANAFKNNITIEEDLSGKKIIIIDDVIYSGSVLADYMNAAMERGAQKDDITTIAYWDSKGKENKTFELEAMKYFAAHPGIINMEDYELTQSFLKFLIRLSEDVTELSNVLSSLNKDKILEVFNKMSLGFRLDILPPEELGAFKNIFNEAVNIFWPELKTSGEAGCAILKEIKEGFPQRDIVTKGTLYASLSDWPSESSLLLWAYIMNYDYVVLEDRRTLTALQTEQLIRCAEILKISYTSPYFTTLSRDIYCPEEIIETQDILILAPELAKFKERLANVREQVLGEFRQLTDSDFDKSLEISQRYSYELIRIAQGTIQLVWKKFESEFMGLDEKNIGVLVGGSTARGEASILSDLDLDIVVKDDSKIDLVLQFSRRFIEALRAVGIMVTPKNIFLENIRSGYYLFNLDNPIPENLSQDNRVSALIRVISDKCIWGNEELLQQLICGKILQERITELIPAFRSLVQSYLKIAEKGEGRIGYRDYRVWWDKERGLVYDIQEGLRFFQLGLYYLLLNKFGINNLSQDVFSALELVFDSGTVDSNLWNKEKIKEAYTFLLMFRHKKASLLDSLYAAGLTDTSWSINDELDILSDFISSNLPEE